MAASSSRQLSLPTTVREAGGIDAWNAQSDSVTRLKKIVDEMCGAKTVDEVLANVKAVEKHGDQLVAYTYMRELFLKNPDLYFSALISNPDLLLAIVYTPTVGEACQKFGEMPLHRRGCYVSRTERGNIRRVLEEYAEAELTKGADGKYLCDCIVFSDGGRILGLGDLGTWGMGIPIGKLDLYTVCAGVNPHRTMPVILDAGCFDASGNTGRLLIRDHERYTGLKENRVTHTSEVGTVVNSMYYGEDNFIEEFMQAAVDVFGKNVLLQFEDFNSNDAFPLLAQYRERFLTYNDDIQGTAAVAVAALMGAIKLRKPECTDLISEMRKETFLFHGAGSANIGTMRLLSKEAGVPLEQINVTNSKGLIWKSADGKQGSFRNCEQKEFARIGEPDYDSKNLTAVIEHVKPSSLIGAVGRDPGCFTKEVVDKIVEVNGEKRPGIYALSNPMTQAEINSEDCWTWSAGHAIYGSGTGMPSVEVNGKKHSPGQVNNVYIFPGVSMGCVCCQASSIPERFFMVAAEAVANSLDQEELAVDRVVPHPRRVRAVGLNVAVAVVLEAQKLGLAGRSLGQNSEEVRRAVEGMMWSPGQ